MADQTSQTGDIVARVLDINSDELKQLASANIIIKTGINKYNLLGSVSGYITYLRDQNKKAPTQFEIAQHLDMSERNVRDVLKNLDIDWRESTLDKIRNAYIRDMREKAAGRGGEGQESLTHARIESETIKAALGRIDYNTKIGALVPASDGEDILVEWADYTVREIDNCNKALIHEIETIFSISIDADTVSKIVNPSSERIGGYATKLGSRIAKSGEVVSSS